MKIYNPTGFSTNLTGSFSGSVKGTLTATGNIIPDVSGAYDIGSTEFPFKDLYITQNSLKFIDDSTGNEIGRISVNSNTGDIKLLNTKNLTEEQKATLTAENVGAEALSPVSASALWVSQSISPGHVNTNIGHDTAPFHTLYTQFVSGSSATLTGDLTVGGKVTAQEFHTEFVSASIIYESGSTKFGNSSDDTHEFTGNVGIGTDTPDYRLEVESTSDLDLVSLKSTAGANNTQMRLGISGSHSVINSTGGSSGNLVLKTYGSERMRIDTNGSVGIGTGTPGAKLNVAGNLGAVIGGGGSSIKMTNVDSGNYASISAGIVGVTNAGMDFSVDGSRGMVLNSTGLAIGAPTPVRRLHIEGPSISSDTPTIRISSTDSSGTNKFGIEFYSNNGADVRGKLLADNNGRVYIDDNGGGGIVLQANGGTGNVGIGTGTPIAKLDIVNPAGVSGEHALILQKAGGYGSTEFYQYYNSTSDYGLNFGLAVSSDTDGRSSISLKSTTGGSGTIVFTTTSTERMRISSGGNVVIGTNGQSVASDADLTILANTGEFAGLDFKSLRTSGNIGGIRFYDSNDTLQSQLLVEVDGKYVFYNATAQPRMTILSGGSVGIGTTNPSTQLNVGDASHGIGLAYLGGSALPSIAGLFTSSGAAGGQSGYGSLLIKARSDYGGYYSLNFFTAASNNTPVERMRITSSGNVSIANTSPQAKLDVTGGIRQSNTAATFSRVQTVHGQTGAYSTVKVIFNKTNWGSVTYDIKVASAGGTYHTAGAYYSNPGFSNDLVSISTGSGISVSKTAENLTGGTQGATWTFSGGTMIHPIVTVDIASGNGFQVTEDSIIVQFTPA